MIQKPIRKEPAEGYKPEPVPKALKMIYGGKAMNEKERFQENAVNASPVKNKVGSLFIPVRDIGKSRSWYCRVLGLNESDAPIHNGHLCPLPMDGAGLILDTMTKWGGDAPEGPPRFETPAFMLMTDDLEGSLRYMKQLGAELVTEIEHDHWFVAKDPDGNMLMICRE